MSVVRVMWTVQGTVEHGLWECCRFEEGRREFPGEDAVENVRLGLREVMEN